MIIILICILCIIVLLSFGVGMNYGWDQCNKDQFETLKRYLEIQIKE